MPRDKKGIPFGIDTVVETPQGEMEVHGFIVVDHALSRDQIQRVQQIVCEGYCDPATEIGAFFWHEVHAKDDKKNPWKDVPNDHTDMCHMDKAQAKGLQLPEGREAVLGVTAAENIQADKAVWGGSAN